MKRKHILLGVLFALAVVTHAGAGRYRVSIADLEPITIDDAASFAGPAARDFAACPPVSLKPEPATTAPPVVVALPPDRVPLTVPPSPEACLPLAASEAEPVLGERAPARTGSSVAPPSAPPTPIATATAFVCGFTAPGEIQEATQLCQDEPRELAEAQRVENAAIRWTLQSGRAPSGSSMTTTPEELPPHATRAVVRKKGGLEVRVAPWGASSGARLSEGQALELQSPSHEGWYRVGGTGTGWVPGIWLSFK